MFPKQILHSKKSGASRNEIIEDDDVRLIGQVVWIKHSPYTLLATAMSAVEVEGNAKFLASPSDTSVAKLRSLCRRMGVVTIDHEPSQM